MKKYFFPVIITVITLFTVNVWASFSDVPASDSNADAIAYMQTHGLVEGYADGSFHAEYKINRAEFLKIVIRASLMEIGPGVDDSGCFLDVQNQWFAKYVCFAKKYGWIRGYSDGNFHPERNINFAEAAKILAEKLQVNPSFTGSDPWYREYVDFLAGKFAIPTTISTFDQEITRGETVEMIYRILAGITSKPSHNYDTLVGGWTISNPQETTISVDANNVSINFSQCDLTQKQVWLSLGSAFFSITGRTDTSCLMNFGGEVEMGQKPVSYCMIPRTLGTVTMAIRSTSVDTTAISTYCTLTTPTPAPSPTSCVPPPACLCPALGDTRGYMCQLPWKQEYCACPNVIVDCKPTGTSCSTNADCGTYCGATCQGDGMTASIPPHMINGKCTYPSNATPTPSPQKTVCPAPGSLECANPEVPAGCSLKGSVDANGCTQCPTVSCP